ncbi:hypothetical protein GYMLUDRAFT_154566, partial [Collybiopsis luxurians FD-317 M1]
MVQEVYPSLPDDNKLLIKENGKVVDVCLTRLRDVAASLRDQQRGLVKLQRACLTIQAVLDFHRQIRRAASPDFISKPVTANSCKMGAFVYNDMDAQFLYSNGFPVYYVREY